MSDISEQNEKLVLEAFDTLFNRRDYAAAERFWSAEYTQHSAQREGHIGEESALTGRPQRLRAQLVLSKQNAKCIKTIAPSPRRF